MELDGRKLGPLDKVRDQLNVVGRKCARAHSANAKSVCFDVEADQAEAPKFNRSA
jgi:hypothetical protein